MKNSKNTIFRRVLGVHAAILFLMLFIPWLRGCFRPRPREIVTYINFAPVTADVAPAPEPTPEPEPARRPDPPPRSDPPPRPDPTPPPQAAPKPEPTPEPAPRPAWRPAEVVRQDTPAQRTIPAPDPQPTRQPTIDPATVRETLERVAGGRSDPLAAYYEQVRIRLYEVWHPPAGVPLGLTATARIRVEPDGSISSKSISRRSGHAAFDQSVQEALNRITRLPRPPANLPDRTIDIEFDLR